MKRPKMHILLLILCMQLVSAYKFRCWWFCSEQTGIQTDYLNDREACRNYAQLRVETDTANTDVATDKGRSSKLLAVFADCMADKGWTMPEGKAAAAPAPAPAPTPAPAAPLPANAKSDAELLKEQNNAKAALMRTSECAFARHGAPYSTVSATRAQACDIECAEGRKLGKEPAACPVEK